MYGGVEVSDGNPGRAADQVVPVVGVDTVEAEQDMEVHSAPRRWISTGGWRGEREAGTAGNGSAESG
ncbi:hypothetical protein GCM10012279_25010 [Micromonospora yangpuensis]|nr:hypothetical protein GCM10012279_25010 [Micromonospora yangpuensis]